MGKSITLKFEGKDYTLEFTRASISTMERQGFVASEILEKPMITLPTLFAGAFIARHRFTKREEIDRIFDKITDKAEFISKLSDMYNDPIQALMDEPAEEDETKNATWGASW